jgi:hypothetical protein
MCPQKSIKTDNTAIKSSETIEDQKGVGHILTYMDI